MFMMTLSSLEYMLLESSSLYEGLVSCGNIRTVRRE